MSTVARTIIQPAGAIPVEGVRVTDTARTHGVAIIDVDAPDHAICTREVKTVVGVVAWIINNRTGNTLTVGINDFTAVPNAGAPAFDWLTPNPNPVPPFSTSFIILRARAASIPGDRYKYNVTIDGKPVLDPQLVI